jgi:ATP-dependent DNA helicase RecG
VPAFQPLSQAPVTQLKGVGAKVAEKLQKLNISSIQDLLFHLPYRYEDRTRIYPLKDTRSGMHCTIQGEVVNANIQYGKKRMLVVRLSDSSSSITLRFFHFGKAQCEVMTPGQLIRCFGEIKTGKHGLEMMHPEFKALQSEHQQVEESLTPVYPTTEGLRQASLRSLTEEALSRISNNSIEDLIPQGSYSTQLSLEEALMLVHRPTPEVDISLLEEGKHPAQQRLIVEELAAHHLSTLKLRDQVNQQPGFAIRSVESALTTQFLNTLPFSPTAAQQRVVQDIINDIGKAHPMMRLVQGDVGSGKTLVAALAALRVIEAGFQVALMAPTELLAEQHAKNFEGWFAPLSIKVGWLSGKQKGNTRKNTLMQLKSGEISMMVGTHALFQDAVEYQRLALVIIDEQHRFGVHQRLALRDKGERQGCHPHQLIMTATPIPRTLAMTAYADLDTSIIDELPPGRTPVTTVALPDTRRADVIARVHEACKEHGRQAYWVCTLIEESEFLQSQAAEDTATALKTALPDCKIGLVHGRLKAEEKKAIMDSFKQGALDLLVATTVIEVGVDVPNASLMIIENPERLGLAQLHQLRGRVGRGATQSHCVLMYQSPLSKTATKRLAVLRDSTDGFYIAQMDLEIRGPGELMGTRQTGLADLRIADLVRDAELIPLSQSVAQLLWQNYRDNATALIQRWIGQKEQYGQA